MNTDTLTPSPAPPRAEALAAEYAHLRARYPAMGILGALLDNLDQRMARLEAAADGSTDSPITAHRSPVEG